MNEDIFWEAQWAISLLEDSRWWGRITDDEEVALDVLLQLKR